MRAMQAVMISRPGPPEVLTIGETNPPAPNAGEVLVRVRAAGVNRADVLQRQGRYPPPPGIREDIPGLEFAGEVEESGAETGGWKTGDRVMGLVSGGAYAQYVTCPSRLLIRVPSEMTFIEAAALPEVFITAYDALFKRLQICSGESLLIHAAASGVGTAAIQLARCEGVRVFGTASLKSKLDALPELGLDLPINYREQSFSEEVLKATRGKGVDAILDLVGGSHFAHNLDSLAELGRMVVVGLVGGSKADMDLSLLLRKRLTIIGTVLRSRTLVEKARLIADFEAHAGPLLDSGAIRPVVDRVFPLSLACQAHIYMESNQNTGKIVLEVG